MKLYFAVDQFYSGGAGRVASILINGLVERGYEVVVETDLRRPMTYQLNPQVILTQAPLAHPDKNRIGRMFNVVNRIRERRRLLKLYRPDIIISFNCVMFAELLIAKKGLKIPVITSDHTSMGRDLGRKMNYIRHHLYGCADAITILTHKDERLLGKKFGEKKHVVYNPLTFEPVAIFDGTNRRKNILCIGRVDDWHVKGYDRMIEIWAKLWQKHPDWTLEIAGPASDESVERLLEMAKRHGASNIKFLGNINDMRSLYQSSAILALPSRVEGFPMVLVEAMSQGVACVSFAMQGAIEEILTDGEDGRIIEDGDLESFGAALSELIENEDKRMAIAEKALTSVGRFSRQRFLDAWDKLVNQILKK